jgi:membrane-bound O-acyltransferase GUP1_2
VGHISLTAAHFDKASLCQDNSDSQYRTFRNNLIPLTFLALVLFILSYIYNRAPRVSSVPRTSDKLHRIPFLAVFSITMIIFLHGFSALKIAFILLGNFLIAKLTCSSANPEYLGPSLTWAFNGLVLYSNETYGGYKFAHLHPSFSILVRFVFYNYKWLARASNGDYLS